MTKTVLTAAVLALAFAAAAAASTPAQYRRQATAICRHTTATLKTVKDPTSPRDISRYLKQALPIFRTQYLALGRLTPPASLRPLVAKALSSERLQLIGIRSLIADLDLSSNPKATFDAYNRKLSPLSDAEDAAWKQLRIPACVSV